MQTKIPAKCNARLLQYFGVIVTYTKALYNKIMFHTQFYVYLPASPDVVIPKGVVAVVPF